MRLPSGDHTGAVGSSCQSVMRVAVPPPIGITHSAPWLENTRRLPSGDGDAAIFVPSRSSTLKSWVGPRRSFNWSMRPPCNWQADSRKALAAMPNAVLRAVL
jgi:hypothetical protein